MSYTTISELPELLQTDIVGSEYILITNTNNISNKVQIGTIENAIGDAVKTVIEEPINIKLEELNTKIDTVSASNQITVLDEGSEVGSAKKINFIGATVNSFIDSDTGTIDVYIPSATYSSNFNTNNNNTDARIVGIITSDRYVSEPIDNFYLDLMQPGTLQKCTKNSIINYSSTDKFYVEFNSKIRIEISQGLISDVLEFDINNGTYNSDYISSNITNKQKELSHFTANFNCIIDLTNWYGEVKISIKYIGSSVFEFTETFFTDYSTEVADIEIIPEIINSTYNYLSGIKYLGSGTAIKNTITLLNSKSFTYPSNLFDIDGTLAGLNSYSFLAQDLNIVDYKYNSNIELVRTYNILSNKFYNGSLNIKARVNDWNLGNYKSFSIPALVNTFTDSSTRIYESFVSETNRLKSDLTQFSSDSVLGDFDLQVYNSKLVYPQLDFSAFYNNPDYTTLVSDRTYIRKFWHNNISHSNGLFSIISNITEADLNSKVKIEISLDGINWYNCCSEYLGGVLVNNSGCRINSDSNSLNINNKIEFTLGLNKFTNSSSNWGIYCKITIKEIAKDKYIDILQITNWN